MKPLKFSVLISLVVVFASCSKEETPAPVVITLPPIPQHPPKTKAELLASHPWKYEMLVHNSHDAVPDTVYIRGRANNTLNLDGDTYTYNINGTFTAVLSSVSSVVSGKWNFIPDDSRIEVRDLNGALTSTATILQIDANNYIFMYADMDSYGKLIPQ